MKFAKMEIHKQMTKNLATIPIRLFRPTPFMLETFVMSCLLHTICAFLSRVYALFSSEVALFLADINFKGPLLKETYNCLVLFNYSFLLFSLVMSSK